MSSVTSKLLARLPLILITCSLIAIPEPVYAHPDFPIADTTIEVQPRQFVEFPLSIHYHRVVGSFDVIAPQGSIVTALVMDDQTFSKYASGQPSSPLYSSGKVGTGRLNLLIFCCPVHVWSGEYDQELTYTKYHLVIDNTESSSSATVRLQAILLHDGVAAVMHGAEPFALGLYGGLFGAIGVILSVFMRRGARATTVASAKDGRARTKMLLLSVGSLAIFSAAYALGFGLAITETEISRSGGYLMPLLWILAIFLWLQGYRMTAPLGSRLAGSIGVIEGLGPLLVASFLAWNYGWNYGSIAALLIPALLGGVVGLPQVVGGFYLIQKTQRQALHI
ncbi:MAG: hypothetical protein HY685_07225 [Chloroflexi bacterium]|nr:hypothetical protein [Chloroflexota bacterium]